MSNYIPNRQKKSRIFHKRETELRHAIKNCHAFDRIEAATVAVRDAKLAAIKAQFDEKRDPDEDRLLRKWREMTVDEIVDKYSKGAR